jgi:hypothetical protein
VIPFASERFDYGSWFDTANYQAVVPTDGEYVFQAQAQAVDIDADEYCYLYLLLDRGGSTYLLAIGHKHYAINANEQPFVGVSWIGAAQRGDKVSVIFAHDHPVSTDVNGDAGSVANLTWFSGFKL